MNLDPLAIEMICKIILRINPYKIRLLSMYQMVQSMNQMMQMQSMYPMMNMKGMNSMDGIHPMMEMNEMRQMESTNMQDDQRQFPIPMLVKLNQLSSNQIQISYDRDVDMMKGMKVTNYWIQDTMNDSPKGIATLGMNDNVNAGNSLTNSMARIEPMSGSARTFIITFNRDIPRGAEYKLIICYVTVKGAPPYNGDNGMVTFIGK